MRILQLVSRKEALLTGQVPLEAAQQRYKARAEKPRCELEFAVGDRVLLSTENIALNGGGRSSVPSLLDPLSFC